ncbi:hypothetical protein LEP1GSC047_1115 [Leptospira inadai serovar Lyme str. 10]|uniref:Uncharacterized protein n=1 Tax=Leptospira inadai serovar Lyme str. 10 TaxID=1049790 RepID=V6HAK2_9LEPT|nr:hypothetical protein LEP1GSC047_1115 [Leptospira inadai serovar Lyme str. 10]
MQTFVNFDRFLPGSNVFEPFFLPEYVPKSLFFGSRSI